MKYFQNFSNFVKEKFLALILFFIFYAAVPASTDNIVEESTVPSAYIFNLTNLDIKELEIDGVATGIKISPIEMNPVLSVGSPQKMDVTSFYDSNLTVIFSNNQKWTQTILAQPPAGKTAEPVAIWLLQNGVLVSDVVGNVKQFAWDS